MALLRNITAALLALALTSCYEEFSPKIDTTPVLCMNSLITAGQPIEVELSRTWVYNDPTSQNDHSVKNASVHIYANSELRDNTYIPQQGDRIRLVAECPGYEPAEAEVTVPYAVPFSSIDCKPVLLSRWTMDVPGWDFVEQMSFNTYFTLCISDVPDRTDYYRFTFEGFENDNVATDFHIGSFEYESEPIFSEHIGAFEIVMGSTAWNFQFFTDRQFSGKDYKMHINFMSGAFAANMTEFDDSALDCGYTLTLSTVSESFYNWEIYRWQVSEGIGNDMSDVGLSDPLISYSNVSTGAGVVAAQACTSYRINMADFLKSCLEENNQQNNKPE